MSSHRCAVLALLLALSTPVLSLPVPRRRVKRRGRSLKRNFDAFIGERQLGTHRYEFTGDGEALTLRSEAHLSLSSAFDAILLRPVAEER